MKERGDTDLSAAILERRLTVYKWPRNSCVVLKSLFCEQAARQQSAPGNSMINYISPVFVKKKITQ
jgi:hypothetical protein